MDIGDSIPLMGTIVDIQDKVVLFIIEGDPLGRVYRQYIDDLEDMKSVCEQSNS